MNVYRKSLIVQMLLFLVFFVMGGYIILEYYLLDQFKWIGFVLLGVLAGAAVLGFLIYRKPDQSVAVITELELKRIKYLLYAYFGIYILEIYLSSIESLNQAVVAIATGIVLMAIASTGLWIQYRIIRHK